ncbi:protein of unknown function [Taphrina deformans PYCC 5710]|uniref:Uncharacterized protein n=1 Tax=Taphrina deformans (strain PYCC 5710 / ATCC 11124 / CBS 356.35 / IMI 108563 / JCM 9778 / NBRC 8474) TaxID=1097556 RepID=R4XK12_TAPDE|nr:protein of unknown function [Taphrina deformans PYCC 5710]|eukprot:CCG84793.1 protein of unknown function [Taphrina deformans PYCC 5710]
MATLQDDQKLEDLLTIVITTSPTPSAPAPELIQRVLASLPEELAAVSLIVTFDGFSIARADRAGGRLKKGQVPEGMAGQYPAYIENVKGHLGESWSEEVRDASTHAFVSTCDNGGGGGPGRCRRRRRVTSIRQSFRQGFGMNVRSALAYAATPFILTLQHDWVFTRPTPPFAALCRIMAREPGVRYVTFVARQSRRYETSRGGTSARYAELMRCGKRARAGLDLQHALVPCLHFFDRPHLCSVALYRDLFRSGLVRRGDFIEDTYGCALIEALNRADSQDAAYQVWHTVGSWMYHPDQGDTVAVRHTSGRTCLPQEQQRQRIQEYIRTNRSKQSGRSGSNDDGRLDD